MKVNNIEISSYSFDPINSKMYVIISNNSALIVDPVISNEALRNLKNHRVKDVLIFLTHEHYDHISGVNWIKSKLSCKVICSQKCSERIPFPEKNLSKHFDILFMMEPDKIRKQMRDMNENSFSCHADYTFEEEMELEWHGMKLILKETPGHSVGSICILSDKGFLFTGDTIVNGAATITKLPGGSRKQLELITKPWIESLSADLTILPGHGEAGILKNLKSNMERKR